MPKLVEESRLGIAICNHESLESLTAAIPTMIGEVFASGRPVIIRKGVSDLGRLISSAKTGLVID